MTDHTPETWGRPRAKIRGWLALSQEDYDRAKACVDACAGIPTEQLTSPFVGGLLARLEEAQHVIDALQGRLAGPVSGMAPLRKD